MSSRSLMSTVLVASVIGFLLASAVYPQAISDTYPRSLVEAENKRSSRLRFEDRSKMVFRVASRKYDYRLDELISIDLALANLSDEFLFTLAPSPLTVKLKATDAEGKEVLVGDYTIYQHGFTSNTYQLLASGETYESRILLLVGCKEQGAHMLKKWEVQSSSLALPPKSRAMSALDRELYVGFGDACLDVTGSGAFHISTELKTSKFVVSTKSRIRTFIDGLRSNEIQIRVGL